MKLTFESLVSLAILAGCGAHGSSPVEGEDGVVPEDQPGAIGLPSAESEPDGGVALAAFETWEEFRARATRVVNERELYVVEWDLVLTLDELRDYYARHIASVDAASGPKLFSTVSLVGGADDIWKNGKQLDLTYCVSNLFGDRKSRVVDEMATAAAAWEAVASVNFVYAPLTDAFCAPTNNVVIAVLPLQSGGGGGTQQPNAGLLARAFFPRDGKGELLIDLSNIDDGVNGAPNVRSVGVLRHELGHVLGLRHEHVRAPGSPCSSGEDSSFVGLTAYDKQSVMHYPDCQGDVSSSYTLSTLDDEGVSSLYGPEPARPGLHVEYTGCRQGAPSFAIDLFTKRGVAGTRYDIDFRRGSTGAWQSLSDGPSRHASYRGANRRHDAIRARVCNSAGCSSFTNASAYADCSTLPQ